MSDCVANSVNLCAYFEHFDSKYGLCVTSDSDFSRFHQNGTESGAVWLGDLKPTAIQTVTIPSN